MIEFQKIPKELSERKEWIDFLYEHPVVNDPEKNHFNLVIRPAYVDPKTKTIDADESLNTHFEIWVQGGPALDISHGKMLDSSKWGLLCWTDFNCWEATHDYRLNSSGDTLEEALLNFVARLKYYYNDDGTDRKQ